MGAHRIYTDEQWQWVAARHREGYTARELAEFLGVHRNTIRAGLIRMGVKPERRENLPPLSKRRAEFAAITVKNPRETYPEGAAAVRRRR